MKGIYDVLITDSRYKHSLAIVRSLGQAGLRVATCSEGFSPTIFSRYSKKSFTYNRENFDEKLLSFLMKNEVKLVLPVGYFSNIECSRIKDKIKKYSDIIIEDFDKITQVSDKGKIIPILIKNKINFPKTYTINRIADLKRIQGKGFAVKSTEEEIGEKVSYVKSIKELKNTVSERLVFGPQIVQEYVDGEGRGFFAFCNDGKILQSFHHKRIRQYPESGGVSSCAESIHDKKLESISEKLLSNLNWTGPVMLEYIYNKKDKKYYFIELNAKFWGSYDLSVANGLNFAKIPFDIVSGDKIHPKKYEVGKRFQWVLPEDTIRIKTSKNKKRARKEWVKDLLDPSVKKDIQYIFNDPLPAIIRIFSTLWKYYLKK